MKDILIPLKTEHFEAEPATPFEELVEFEDISSATSVSQHCKIMGIQQSYKKIACVSCYKTVIPADDNILGDCESCKVTQVLDNCPVNWTLSLLLQTENNRNIHLTFTHQMVQDLNAIFDPTFEIKYTTSEKDLILAFSRTFFVVSYDDMDYKILSIRP